MAGLLPVPSHFRVRCVQFPLERAVAGKRQHFHSRMVVNNAQWQTFHVLFWAIPFRAECAGGRLGNPDLEVNGKEWPIPGSDYAFPNALKVGIFGWRTVAFGQRGGSGFEDLASESNAAPTTNHQ